MSTLDEVQGMEPAMGFEPMIALLGKAALGH